MVDRSALVTRAGRKGHPVLGRRSLRRLDDTALATQRVRFLGNTGGLDLLRSWLLGPYLG